MLWDYLSFMWKKNYWHMGGSQGQLKKSQWTGKGYLKYGLKI